MSDTQALTFIGNAVKKLSDSIDGTASGRNPDRQRYARYAAFVALRDAIGALDLDEEYAMKTFGDTLKVPKER